MLSDLRNSADYPLRQWFRWQRPGLKFRNEPKSDLYDHLPQPARQFAQETAARLLDEYRLSDLYHASTAENYRENLFYLEMLEQALHTASPTLPPAIAAADIGPSSWFYVHALHAALKWWQCSAGREVALTGCEADAFRVYLDFHSRFDHARAHLRGLTGARYLPRRFEPLPATFDLITLLFPFVFLKEHLAWGLPARLFSPVQLLADAWHSLKPGGLLVIVNQGEAEHRAQRDLLQSAAIHPLAAYRHESTLFQYDLPRWVLVVVKDDEPRVFAAKSGRR
ncbi:MAG: hypothetical protein HY260_22875 [Chloroflexi bacterium]|nr:hypothetical protein [Chloroflexota bacterium]